jgi:hypothetical protein
MSGCANSPCQKSRDFAKPCRRPSGQRREAKTTGAATDLGTICGKAEAMPHNLGCQNLSGIGHSACLDFCHWLLRPVRSAGSRQRSARAYRERAERPDLHGHGGHRCSQIGIFAPRSVVWTGRRPSPVENPGMR